MSGGLKINRKQTIASFFSKVYPNPVEASLDSEPDNTDLPNQFKHVASDRIRIGRDGETGLLISLMRTVRVPEDQSNYDLPPGLGRFPVFNMKPFSDRLPASMVAQGGLFFPMYQMEAMWINFEPSPKTKYAIRPFLGGVNGITGEAAISDMTSLLRRMNSLGPEQEYIVVPDQKWLDGIATSPGIVRQFVAAKPAPFPREKRLSKSERTEAAVTGSTSSHVTSDREGNSDGEPGATIEWQVTGRDAVGGIQLQLIPEFDTSVMSAGSEKNVYRDKDGFTKGAKASRMSVKFYDVLQTPRELGLTPRDVIHIKNVAAMKEHRPKTLGDLLAELPADAHPSNAGIVELKVDRGQVEKWTFVVKKDCRSVSFSTFEVNTPSWSPPMILWI